MAAAYGTREVQNRTRREVRTASVLDSRDPMSQSVRVYSEVRTTSVLDSRDPRSQSVNRRVWFEPPRPRSQSVYIFLVRIDAAHTSHKVGCELYRVTPQFEGV